MKGFVPTPERIVDMMVAKLFHGHPPAVSSSVLDPGCGSGAFIEGIVRWCRASGLGLPQIVGIESNPRHLEEAHRRLDNLPSVDLRLSDFLSSTDERYDFIIGNPPYVPITQLSEDEKGLYRTRYTTAQGRFDLYLLFFEQALSMLRPGGRLVFITPEKFLYVATAKPLRRMFDELQVEEVHFLDEGTFGDLVTYPVVTTVLNRPHRTGTRVLRRDGHADIIATPVQGGSWLPSINGKSQEKSVVTLSDVCLRISCGVATGADSVYVMKTSELPSDLRRFAHPAIAGRDIAPGQPLVSSRSMLVPYTLQGELLPENKLGALGDYLRRPEHRQKLLKRTCVERKEWYAFHETPPLVAIRRPKILCKDITAIPSFLIDEIGTIVPQHSVYYIVPRDSSRLHELAAYLNTDHTQAWLRAHCQRASKGFLRLQSEVLKRVPLPAEWAVSASGTAKLEVEESEELVG